MKVIQQLAAETGFVVMSPDYRRAPQHPFPAPYDDCLKSTLEFIDRAPEFHVNPKQIVLSGDSAGSSYSYHKSCSMSTCFCTKRFQDL